MKHILATEQKKTDFRPEDENNVMIQYTTVSKLLAPCPRAKLNKSADATFKSLAELHCFSRKQKKKPTTVNCLVV